MVPKVMLEINAFSHSETTKLILLNMVNEM